MRWHPNNFPYKVQGVAFRRVLHKAGVHPSGDLVLHQLQGSIYHPKAIADDLRGGLQGLDGGNRAGVLRGLGRLREMRPDGASNGSSEVAIIAGVVDGPRCSPELGHRVAGGRTVTESPAAAHVGPGPARRVDVVVPSDLHLPRGGRLGEAVGWVVPDAS